MRLFPSLRCCSFRRLFLPLCLFCLLFAYVFPLVLAFRSFRSKLGTYFRRTSSGATLNCCLAVCFMLSACLYTIPQRSDPIALLPFCFLAFFSPRPFPRSLPLSLSLFSPLSLFSWRMFAFLLSVSCAAHCCTAPASIPAPQNEPRKKACRFPNGLGVRSLRPARLTVRGRRSRSREPLADAK